MSKGLSARCISQPPIIAHHPPYLIITSSALRIAVQLPVMFVGTAAERLCFSGDCFPNLHILPFPSSSFPQAASHLRIAMFPHLIAVILLILLTEATAAESSLHAYIPASHKTAFDNYNALILGDLSVAKAAFRGPLAVQGKADLADFDISFSRPCNRDRRAITVGGTLTARMGTVHGGYTVLGRGSRVHHSVKMDCTSRIERYDPARNDDPEFGPMRENLIRENGDMCVTDGKTIEAVNETMTFKLEEETFSCYDFFKVKTDELRLVKKWIYDGDYERNVVVVVTGLRHEFREFRMEGFNPKKTLIVFCAVYGSFGFFNTRFEGSLFAPTASFTTMDTIINGSLIVGGLRGSLASLDVPYQTC